MPSDLQPSARGDLPVASVSGATPLDYRSRVRVLLALPDSATSPVPAILSRSTVEFHYLAAHGSGVPDPSAALAADLLDSTLDTEQWLEVEPAADRAAVPSRRAMPAMYPEPALNEEVPTPKEQPSPSSTLTQQTTIMIPGTTGRQGSPSGYAAPYRTLDLLSGMHADVPVAGRGDVADQHHAAPADPEQTAVPPVRDSLRTLPYSAPPRSPSPFVAEERDEPPESLSSTGSEGEGARNMAISTPDDLPERRSGIGTHPETHRNAAAISAEAHQSGARPDQIGLSQPVLADVDGETDHGEPRHPSPDAMAPVGAPPPVHDVGSIVIPSAGATVMSATPRPSASTGTVAPPVHDVGSTVTPSAGATGLPATPRPSAGAGTVAPPATERGEPRHTVELLPERQFDSMRPATRVHARPDEVQEHPAPRLATPAITTPVAADSSSTRRMTAVALLPMEYMPPDSNASGGSSAAARKTAEQIEQLQRTVANLVTQIDAQKQQQVGTAFLPPHPSVISRPPAQQSRPVAVYWERRYLRRLQRWPRR